MKWCLRKSTLPLVTWPDEKYLWDLLFCHREFMMASSVFGPRKIYSALPCDADYRLGQGTLDPTDSVNVIIDATTADRRKLCCILESLGSPSVAYPTFGYGRYGGFERYGLSRGRGLASRN